MAMFFDVSTSQGSAKGPESRVPLPGGEEARNSIAHAHHGWRFRVLAASCDRHTNSDAPNYGISHIYPRIPCGRIVSIKRTFHIFFFLCWQLVLHHKSLKQ